MANNSTTPKEALFPSNYCSMEQDLIENTYFQVILSCLYGLIFVIGSSGNVLVTYVILRNKSMQNPTNIFISNLAFADMLMCLLSVPLTPAQSFTGRWYFGSVLCTLFPVSQGVSVHVSTLTMTVIALDRFVVVCYPYRQRIQSKTSILFVALIDILAIIFVLPYALHIKIIVGYDGEDRCNEVWFGSYRTAYGIFTVFTQFALPFLTIIGCYTCIIFKMKKRPQERRDLVLQSSAKQELEKKRMKRTNQMLMIMVIIFGSAWFPLNMINLVADLNIFQMHCWNYYHATFIVCHLIAMSSTCFNVFLYGRFNDSFQKEFVDTFPVLKTFYNGCENSEDLLNQFELALTNSRINKI